MPFIARFVIEGRSQAGGAADTYTQTFTDDDLTPLLTVTHNLGKTPTAIAVKDNTGEIVVPDNIEILSDSQVAIDLTNYRPIQSEWTLSIEA